MEASSTFGECSEASCAASKSSQSEHSRATFAPALFKDDESIAAECGGRNVRPPLFRVPLGRHCVNLLHQKHHNCALTQ